MLKKAPLLKTPDVLVCDKIGYLPLGQQGIESAFPGTSHRQQVKSMKIMTNLPFADWIKIFDSTTVAIAVAYHLVYNSPYPKLGGTQLSKKDRAG